MKKYLIRILILIFISVLFYSLYPKYRFHFQNTVIRTNIITGRVEGWSKTDRKWIILVNKTPVKSRVIPHLFDKSKNPFANYPPIEDKKNVAEEQ